MAERKYLYEAKDAQGRPRSGYVEAVAFADARAKLSSQGLADIVVIDDDLTAELRAFAERDGVAPDSDVDLLTRYKPSAWGMAAVAFRKSWIWNTVSLAVAAWLWLSGSPWWALALAVVTVLPIVFPAWIQWRQNEVSREFWRGNYESSERIARKLRGMGFISKVPTVLLELDSRIASAMVKRGDLPGALAVLAPWAESDRVPHATYLIKKGNLHFLARDWPAYIAAMEAVLEATRADFARIDLAQVLARMGDDDARAKALLDGIDTAALSSLHIAFIGFGRGVLALRAGRNDEALRELAHAVDGMQAMGENPLMWGALSVATGYLCVAMARCGLNERARTMFASVRTMVEWHAEDRLLEWLRAEKLTAA